MCGNHQPGDGAPPTVCPICADERQWVPPEGQRWTTMPELVAAGHHCVVRELEAGLTGIGVEPAFAIGQRALLVRTPGGNLLWDPPGFVDERAIRAVRRAGGLSAVSASHPHFYGAIRQWGSAFDAPMLIAEADIGWLHRPDGAVQTWSGTVDVLPGLTLIQCGGHFPGSAVVHWADGAAGAGALLTGDTLFVTPGADRVTFLWSAPNRLPLWEAAVRQVADAVRPYRFDRIYGGWWTPVVDADAARIVQRSAERYIAVLRGDVAPDTGKT